MACAVCKIIWLLSFLSKLHQQHSQPSLLFFDNQTILHIATNPVYHEKTKHIELDYHLIREKIHAKNIKTLHVSLVHQVAEMLTKPLASPSFLSLLSKMNIHNIYNSS